MNRILVIGGTDNSSGAGLFADFETLSKLGAEIRFAVSAVTAQNEERLFHSETIPVANFTAQLDSIDLSSVSSVKIGMLPSSELVKPLASFLGANSPKHIVFDPVFRSSSDYPLISDSGIEAVVDLLLPLTTVITPNLMEASRLTGLNYGSIEQSESMAVKLLETGTSAALVKGGHLDGPSSVDVLAQKNDSLLRFSEERIQGVAKARGTGCRLASSIAFYLAEGHALDVSVKYAKGFVWEYLNECMRSLQQRSKV